jgi:hypothetical protein
MEQTSEQKAKAKYYLKNRDNISASSKSYYQQNKEEILRKKRERYSEKSSQRLLNEFAQTLEDRGLS